MTRLRRRLAAGALLLLCASGGLASCSSDAERRARHESRAETFLAEGKVREGLIELRSALKLEPQSAALHLRIGEVLEGIGDLQEALFFYQEAMRLAPEDSKPALATARLLLFEEPERAQELIDGVIARAPDDALAYMRRSELALARARTDEALEAARTAVEKAPDEHMTHFQLGLVHRARIRERQLLRQPLEPRLFEEALAAFDRGLAVAAEDAPAGEVVRGAIERAFVFAAWDARKAETGPAFRRAVEIARERGSKVEEARALGETQKYAQDAGDEELERWALEAQIAFEPRTYAAWARLAGLSPDDDAVLKRLIETLPEDERAHVLYARILSDRGRDEEAVAHLREVEGRVGDPVPLLAARVEVLLERGELEEARALAHKLTAEHPERPQTLEASSLLAMRERRYAEAAATLRKLLERRETARAQLRLAEAEFRQRNLAPALVAVNRALELATLDEERISMLRMKARIEIASGDPEAGLLTLKRVRRLNRGIVPVDVPMLARALYATKRNESARAVLDDALGKDDVPLTAVLLYLRHEGARDPERAHAVLERAAERYPHNPSLLGYLVRGDFAAGQPERAEARLAAAVAASPDNAALYRLQARALTSSGKHEEALAAAERALELDPERSEAADLMVGLLSRLGRLDEAVERLEAQAKQGKLGLSGRILLARLHIVGGRDPRAIELLESAVAERADLPEAKNDLAFLLAKGGADLERAHRLAEEARSALPRSAEVADTMGYVYLKRGLAAAAAEQFRSALELSDERSATWATAQYHLGLSYKALGREPEARLAFERSLATAVDFPEAADARREAENLAGSAAGAS